MMRVRPSRAAGLVAAGLLIAALTTDASSRAAPLADPATIIGPPVAPIGHAGTWLTDATGRVVVVHGLNQVYKVPPYEPSADGFGDDDAAFLGANGFTGMRVGVIWEAVEPQPGVYDDNYLASIAQTVHTLAAHGVLSLLDFHQDLYNELFQGEGAPAWAVKSGGLPNPRLGFPGNYFLNPAEGFAWNSFWRNAPAPDGIGLQDHYAATWAHVAAYFRGNPGVFGYEILNEPWPGLLWEPCANPAVGCLLNDAKLRSFYNRVVPAIRNADSTTLVFFEPNVLFSEVIHTDLGNVADPNTAFSFHDYCALETVLQKDITCSQQDQAVFNNARRYTTIHHIPALLTEFGATNDLANLTGVLQRADDDRIGWLEWAYTGNDKTSSSPTEQALVFDPNQPPTGSNVNTAKLAVLAAPHPQVVAGTPRSWSFKSGTFRLSYSTARPDGQGRFSPGAQTLVSVPPIEYPSGYHATITGGQVVSAPGAPVLTVVAAAGADSVDVVVTP
jgi:endoglycosylceramidase